MFHKYCYYLVCYYSMHWLYLLFHMYIIVLIIIMSYMYFCVCIFQISIIIIIMYAGISLGHSPVIPQVISGG